MDEMRLNGPGNYRELQETDPWTVVLAKSLCSS